MTETGSYLRPDTMETALEALASGSYTVAAGCTDLYPATERKVLPYDVLDVTGIDALRGIHRDRDGLTIGATTTWTDIVEADLPPALHGLQLAGREVGAKQIQNRGTIAGNLCNASPAADGVPPLLVVDAEVELQSLSGTRTLPLNAFITGPRKTTRRQDELLTAVKIPASSLAGDSNFLKLGAREYLVISIAMVAVRLAVDNGVVSDAALAVGACSPVAIRLPAIEEALIGQPLNPDMIREVAVAESLNPIDDVRADAGYRNVSAAELVRRSLAALRGDAKAAA